MQSKRSNRVLAGIALSADLLQKSTVIEKESEWGQLIAGKVLIPQRQKPPPAPLRETHSATAKASSEFLELTRLIEPVKPSVS